MTANTLRESAKSLREKAGMLEVVADRVVRIHALQQLADPGPERDAYTRALRILEGGV